MVQQLPSMHEAAYKPEHPKMGNVSEDEKEQQNLLMEPGTPVTPALDWPKQEELKASLGSIMRPCPTNANTKIRNKAGSSIWHLSLRATGQEIREEQPGSEKLALLVCREYDALHSRP